MLHNTLYYKQKCWKCLYVNCILKAVQTILSKFCILSSLSARRRLGRITWSRKFDERVILKYHWVGNIFERIRFSDHFWVTAGQANFIWKTALLILTNIFIITLYFAKTMGLSHMFEKIQIVNRFWVAVVRCLQGNFIYKTTLCLNFVFNIFWHFLRWPLDKVAYLIYLTKLLINLTY